MQRSDDNPCACDRRATDDSHWWIQDRIDVAMIRLDYTRLYHSPYDRSCSFLAAATANTEHHVIELIVRTEFESKTECEPHLHGRRG